MHNRADELTGFGKQKPPLFQKLLESSYERGTCNLSLWSLTNQTTDSVNYREEWTDFQPREHREPLIAPIFKELNVPLGKLGHI